MAAFSEISSWNQPVAFDAKPAEMESLQSHLPNHLHSLVIPYTFASLHRRFRLNRRKAAFSVRIVRPWNKVPAYVVESPSADVLNSRLDACWNEVFPDVI